MKIENIRTQPAISQTSQSTNDPFDIDVKIKSIKPVETGVAQAVTSKGLGCTTGCAASYLCSRFAC